MTLSIKDKIEKLKGEGQILAKGKGLAPGSFQALKESFEVESKRLKANLSMEANKTKQLNAKIFEHETNESKVRERNEKSNIILSQLEKTS